MKPSLPHKIGYVVKMFPRLSETFIQNEILELERQGLALRIFSLKRPNEADASLAGSGVKAPVTYLPERVYREPLRVLRAQLVVLWRYPRGYRRLFLHVLRRREVSSLWRGLRRFCQTCCLVHEIGDIEHLHAHFASDPTRLACWAQMVCKRSYSVTTHAKDLYQDDRLGSPGLRNKLSLARFVVANSNYSASGLRAVFNEESPTKIFTIYNSVDLRAFPLRESEPAEPLILSVGRLVEKKGFADLIKACRLLKDRGVTFRCEIIGSGTLGASLRDCITNLGLENTVKLRGQRPHNELRRHYLEAMVFALPCVVADNGDRDILPNVLKEAMAVGVPVVTTRLEGIEELVAHEETGLLTNPGDVEGLATCLQRMLTEPDLRRHLADGARRHIEHHFDLGTNFTKLRKLLGEMLEDRAGTSRQIQKITAKTQRCASLM
jgi:glycosyltransferase involved in cell wall biosynthesis